MDNLPILVDRVEKILAQEEKVPFKVSVMGQTGVGKSSLINALFNTDLKTSATSPSTEFMEEVTVEGRAGHKLLFYDIPGIGISRKADKKFLAEYERKLEESDIVLWAIHCDSRSYAYDLDALDSLFESITRLSRPQIMRKMIFVLTKVDLLTPPPWILAKIGKNGIFVPQEEMVSLVREKEDYVQKNFILRYKGFLTSRTYFDGIFEIDDDKFRFKDNVVSYQGVLSKADLAVLKERFPKYEGVFDRLYDNYRVVSISSRFRFNLDLLTRIIINKLGSGAIARFGHIYTEQSMYTIPLAEAKKYSNIIVVDRDAKKVLFDLPNTNL